MPRFALGFVLWWAIVANAQTLEVIQLKHRTADQVLDTLRPLVEPGETLTGQGNQLIVRVSPANLAEIRRVLDAIDRPQRRLQVSVRFDDAFESSRRELGAGGTISDRGTRIEIRGRDSQSQAEERVDQRLQMLEGARAMIQTGPSRMVRQRRIIQTPAGPVPQDVIVEQDMTSGFEVVPRVSGSMVTMDIYASRAGSTTVSSTASGRLGEWFELGSVVASAARDERGLGSAVSRAGGESRRVWVKVDALDPR
jgi:type II secretory pathway component GspD/PulD (secretin)